MASNFQALLDQYTQQGQQSLADYAAPYGDERPLPQSLGAISVQRREELSKLTGADGYRVSVAQANGGVDPTASETEQDMGNLTPMQLYAKYGDMASNMIASKVAGSQQLSNEAHAGRTGIGTLGDSGLDVVRAFTNTAGGLETLGGALIDKTTGTNIAPAVADTTNQIDSYLKSKQTEGLQARRHATDAIAQMSRESNQRAYEVDKKAGSSNFIAGLKDIGRGVLTGIDSATADPSVTLSEGINAGGSMFTIGPISKALGLAGRPLSKIVEKVAETGVKAGVVSPFSTTVAKALELASKGAVPGAIGLMEGGGAAVDVASQINAMSNDDLMQNSPVFRDLIKSGMSPDEARHEIITKATLEAGGAQGLVGALTGTLVSKLEASPKSILSEHSFLGAVGRETLEEGTQGASSPLIENAVVQNLADKNRKLSEGVGEQLAQGAIYGGLSAGALHAPVSLAHGSINAAVEAGKLAAKGVEAAAPIVRNAAGNVSDLIQNALGPVAPHVKAAADAVQSFTQPLVDRVKEAMKPASTQDNPDQPAGTSAPSYMDRAKAVVEAMPSTAEVVDKIKTYGQTAVEKLAGLMKTAEQRPDKIDPGAVDEVLQHFEANDPEGQALSQEDRASLSLARDVAQANTDFQQTQATLGRNAKQAPNPISQQILVGDGETKVPSVLDHLRGIQTALRNNDIEAAKASMGKLVGLAQTLQNKVEAINTHYEQGDGTIKTGVTYENTTLAGKTRQSATKLWVNPEVPASVQLAQRIANDAKAVTTVSDSVARAYPQLGFGEIQAKPLHPGLQGNVREIVQRARATPAKAGTREDPAFKRAREQEAQFQNEQLQSQKDQAQQKSEPGVTSKLEPVPAPTPVNKEPQPAPQPSEQPVEKPVENSPPADQKFGGNRIYDKLPLGVTPGPDAHQTEEGYAYRTMSQGEYANAKDQGAFLPKAGKARYNGEKQWVRGGKDVAFSPNAENVVVRVPIDRVSPTEPVKFSDAQVILNGSEHTATPATTTTTTEAPKVGHFDKAFTTPKREKSRVSSTDSPISLVDEALSSDGALKELAPKAQGKLTPAIATAYKTVLRHAQAMVGQLNSQLQSFLSKELDGKTIEQHLLDGTQPKNKKGEAYDLLLSPNAKALNLLEQQDGKMVYNPQLLEAAALAGAQWSLVANRFWSKIDEADAGNILGIPESEVTNGDLLNLRQGMGAIEVKLSLAQMIQDFWGKNRNPNADQALTAGIAESVAGEVMRAMIAEGSLEKLDFSDKSRGLKDVIRYRPQTIDQDNPLTAYPTAIQDALSIDSEPEHFIGEAPTKLSSTQMNNPRTPNTSDQMSAVRKESSTPYHLNQPLAKLWQQIGEPLFLKLFGEGDLDKRIEKGELNEQHAKSLKGRNLTLSSAFNTLARLTAQLDNQGSRDKSIFYAHAITKLGRMQQLGRDNPQTSKVMREASLPTESTLDLSDAHGEDMSLYQLGLAQMLGIKVHNISRQAMRDQLTSKLEGDLKPAVDLLTEWHRRDSSDRPMKLTTKHVDQIRSAFGGELEPMNFHAIFDYARLQATADKAAFKTQVYVEADGVSNGPINAIAMATHGRFSTDQVVNLAKGGLFFNEAGQSLNEHRSNVNSEDLYKATSNQITPELMKLMARFGGDQALHTQLQNLLRVMRFLDPKNVMMATDDNGNVSPEFERGIAKNPLTITIYGSGAEGIAGKLVNDLTDKLAEQLSNAAANLARDPSMGIAEAMFGQYATPSRSAEDLFSGFVDTMNDLTHAEVTPAKGGKFVVRKTPGELKLTDPKSFVLSKAEIASFSKNMQHLFVGPLREAIRSTVGEPVFESMDNIRDATNIQSVFLKHAFFEEIQKEMDKLGRKPGQFLSPAEQDAVFKRALNRLAPFIETGKQSFFPAGSNRMTLTTESGNNERQFGHALDGSFRTSGYFDGVDTAGVGGIPMMIVGMGDGYMMQLASNMADAVQGTLKIFDGVNLPLDQAVKGSRQVNEAAFQAMLNNPVKAVADTFRKFLENAQVGELSEAHRLELMDAVYGKYSHPDHTVSDAELRQQMEDLLTSMDEKARSIDARHNVMRRTKVSVDQMAAVGAPFSNESGDINLDGMTEQEAAAELNAAYEEELAKLSTREVIQPADNSFADTLNRVSISIGDGIRTVTSNGLKRLLVNLKEIPAAQKAVLGEIVKSLATKDYQIILGDNLAQIDRWARANAVQPPATLSSSLKGYVSFTNKTIFIASGTSETLVHELIHAATFERLVAHYSGLPLGQNAKEQVEAIGRIESLVDQFLSLNDERQLPYNMREAYANAKAAMNRYAGKTDPVSQAARVNEFMAWALTNEKLTKLLSETKANPLAKVAQAVVDALRSLIWGKRVPPKVADDMLSNLQFNTGVLINSAPTALDLISKATLEHNAEFGNNARLADLQDSFNRLITGSLEVKPDLSLPEQHRDKQLIEDQTHRKAAEVLARLNSNVVANEFDARFPMTQQERGLFELVVAALGTHAEFDANTLSEVGKLYDHVVKNLKVEDFIPANSTDPDADRKLAQEKFDLIVGNLTSAKDLQGRSTEMSAFLALSMVNEEFRQVLSKIEMPKTELGKWNSVDGILDNIGTMAMQNLSELVSGAQRDAPNVQAAMKALETTIINVAQDRQNWIDGTLERGHSIIDKGNELVTRGLNYGADKIVEALDALRDKTDNPTAHKVIDSLKLVKAIVNEDEAGAIQAGFMSQMMKARLPKPVFDLINEIVGRTSENAPVYDMIKLVRAFVQQVRQQFREDLPGILAKKFSRELTKDEWTHLFKGLARTDIVSLMGNRSVDQIGSMLSNIHAVAAEINDAEAEARKLSGTRWPAIQAKAKQLAHFMNTREPGHNLLRNAEAVVQLYGEPGFTAGRQADTAHVNAVDRLVTLYALEGLSEDTKAALSSLAQAEPQGVKFLTSYLVGQRTDEMTRVNQTGIARANAYKGYVPSEAKGGHGLVVRDDSEAQTLKQMGYVRVGDYEGSSHEPVTGTRGYYYSSVAGRGRFNQGIIQNIRPTAGGVDPVTGYTNDGASHGGIVTDPRIIQRIQALEAKQGHKGTEPLLPIYNTAGEVVAYERSIDPVQDKRMSRNTHLGEMIGAWRGRQVEEMVAGEFNRRLVQQLGDLYTDAQKTSRTNEFVNLFAKNLSDPIYRDAVSLINKETRAAIEAQFGKGEFWVRKDMIDDVIGYRSASIGDSWTGISRWPKPMQDAFKTIAHAIFGDKAYQRLMQAEKFWHNFITDARVTIVVKSIIVPMANLAANFLQLLARGVPINHIIRGMPKKTAEIRSYTERRLRQIEVEAELRAVGKDAIAARKLKAELQAINDANRRLSIWPLIEAGEFSSISDTTISHSELLMSEGRLSEYLEGLVHRLPESVRTAGRYAIVARDTSLFKGMQLAVEYGDFLGKAVLFDHLTKKKGMSGTNALARITEEFVNYDRLPGRARAALEANGLIWFWHFKLRAAKVGLSMIRNNPLHAALSMMIPTLFGFENPGSPVSDNFAAVVADPQRLAYTLGMDQAFSAHKLNPVLSMIL